MFCVALTEDVTMVICPGIGNHSEKHYIRTFVDYSQKQGYRCAVLNHLGALPNIELTSPRMFTYGTRVETCIDRLFRKLHISKVIQSMNELFSLLNKAVIHASMYLFIFIIFSLSLQKI